MSSRFPEKPLSQRAQSPRRRNRPISPCPLSISPTFSLCTLWALCSLWLILPPQALADPTTRPTLRIVADPNNLPFSNEKQEGFENHLAHLLARELGADLEFTWYAQRRGYVRNTLKYGDADLVLGVPTTFDPLLTTVPYYRSSYVFLSRADRNLSDLSSLDDPRLRTLTIGIQLIGDDGTNTPPAHALGRRNITTNVKGYSVYSDYRQPNPPARIVDAVASKEIDIALVWGPLAGYFAKHAPVPLTLIPVKEQSDGPYPLTFDISIGVKRKNKPLHAQLNQLLPTLQSQIDKLLDQYNIPRLPATTGNRELGTGNSAPTTARPSHNDRSN